MFSEARLVGAGGHARAVGVASSSTLYFLPGIRMYSVPSVGSGELELELEDECEGSQTGTGGGYSSLRLRVKFSTLRAVLGSRDFDLFFLRKPRGEWNLLDV